MFKRQVKTKYHNQLILRKMWHVINRRVMRYGGEGKSCQESMTMSVYNLDSGLHMLTIKTV
jgi:hypothetical protein